MRAGKVSGALLVIVVAAMMLVAPMIGACPPSPKESGDIKAGKTIDVGDYEVWKDGNILTVKFKIHSGWCIVENHIVVTMDILDSDYVTKKDNPKVGSFPFEASKTDGWWSVDINLNDDPVNWDGRSDIHIAIHVVVKECCSEQSETGWAEHDGEWGSRWGWYIIDP